MLCSITVAACGGGSSSGSGNVVTSGTAAQYFTKKAVGNKWAYTITNTGTVIETIALTVTASSSNAVTYSYIYTPTGGVAGPASTSTAQIDATGALILTPSIGTTSTALPATFSVGTTWVEMPATTAQAAINGTIVAFNVTRTVPGGTFTDCLQVTYGSGAGTMTTYYSPSAGGNFVESINSVSTYQLQPGYIAL